ncbi:MAG: Unknown protein [uncultured Sulfurovum sp.]|uniref:Uncharacterized protein n=1 Tax=uncultured Sulfurovum sp. TaxID=269237 RepID=A0A6S6SA93_9BACT|nr:MAG: Unknown protein [uncultured Sulfurovum sp.]
MVTFQINSTDISAIEQLLNIAKEQLNLQIKVIDGLEKPQKKETKWGEFARKMDGLFTPEIIEHLNESRKEARENFISRIGN